MKWTAPTLVPEERQLAVTSWDPTHVNASAITREMVASVLITRKTANWIPEREDQTASEFLPLSTEHHNNARLISDFYICFRSDIFVIV